MPGDRRQTEALTTRPRQGRCEAEARPRRGWGRRDRGQIAAVAVSGRGHAGRRVTMHRGHCQAFIAPRRDPSTRPARPRITSTDRCNIHNYDTNTNRNPTTLQNVVSVDISRPFTHLASRPLSLSLSLSLAVSLSLADFRLMLKTALFCRRFRFYVAACDSFLVRWRDRNGCLSSSSSSSSLSGGYRHVAIHTSTCLLSPSSSALSTNYMPPVQLYPTV